MSFRLNMGDFERKAREIDAAIDQVPYALSLALNEASKVARSTLIGETWPKGVTVRNRGFMRQALQTEFASKTNLRVALYDSLGRANLAQHSKGGIKKARGMLAIPTKRVVRGATGKVRDSQLPRNLKRKVVKGNLIFQEEGRGKKLKLRLLYKLQPTARIKAAVPFHADFERIMRVEIYRAFPAAMKQAMSGRRVR